MTDFTAPLRERLQQQVAEQHRQAQGANYGRINDFLNNNLDAAGQRQAPMFESADAAAARAQQNQLAQRLQAIASGQQAGAGELAVNRQIGQATAAQQAQAQMARGANTALAARNAARNTADIGVAGAGQAQIAQINDQNAANAQLAGVLGGMRGQDIGIGQGNQGAQLTQTGLNDSAQSRYLAGLLGLDQNTFNNMMMQRQMNLQEKAQHDANSFGGRLMSIGGQALSSYAGGGFGGGGGGGNRWSNGQPSGYGLGGMAMQPNYMLANGTGFSGGAPPWGGGMMQNGMGY